MAWFRSRFCDPSETANEECAMPVFTTTAEGVEWCMENFGNNSTDCIEIRDKAQDDMERSIYVYYYSNAAWTIFFVLLVSVFFFCFFASCCNIPYKLSPSSVIPRGKDAGKYPYSAACSKVKRGQHACVVSAFPSALVVFLRYLVLLIFSLF